MAVEKASGAERPCPVCGEPVKFEIPEDLARDGVVKRCAACPGREFFIRKDFPQKLGMAMVVLFGLIATIFYAYERVGMTFATLGSLVVIDAIIMGGRRASVVPLVRESLGWEHGVFLGATMSSEQTAAAEGAVGSLRFDPFAMLPFTGYHVADYFAHWLSMADREGVTLPRIFYVNWFRKDDQGRFMWPGFGDNSRVLDWIVRRTENAVDAVETPIGLLPNPSDLDTSGLDLDPAVLEQLLTVDLDAVAQELPQVRAHLEAIDHLPPAVLAQLERLEAAVADR